MTKYKILIVDDDRSCIIAMTHLLSPNYEILATRTGKSAFKMARDNQPDLILLDIVMPDISGFDVLTQLKSNEQTHNIPVIFTTGKVSIEDEEAGLFLGAVDYVTKPIKSSILNARIRTHLKIVEYVRTIENMCVIDALTNIPNRRSFDNRLSGEWRRAIREATTISMLLIDLDDFKKVNDTYGHPQGDILLQSVAKVFGETLKRPMDFLARWGGDEFAVLLPNTDFAGASEVARQIRANSEQTVLRCDDAEVRIYVSIGISSASPVVNDSAADFFADADKSLYEAKKEKDKRKLCL